VPVMGKDRGRGYHVGFVTQLECRSLTSTALLTWLCWDVTRSQPWWRLQLINNTQASINFEVGNDLLTQL
jgi:hypothetical protein